MKSVNNNILVSNITIKPSCELKIGKNFHCYVIKSYEGGFTLHNNFISREFNGKAIKETLDEICQR